MLDKLQIIYESNKREIEDWFKKKQGDNALPVYTSVDLRNAGFKIGPVDVNLFPAGFNNITPASKDLAASYLQKYIEQNYENVHKIVLITEHHTRNIKYLDNLVVLQYIIQKAGYEVRLADTDIEQNMLLAGSSGEEIVKYPIHLSSDRTIITSDGFQPDLLILNNDLSAGLPNILQSTVTPIIPDVRYGWYRRHKSRLFEVYSELVVDFASLLGIDPWFLCPISRAYKGVNFRDKTGMDGLVKVVDEVLQLTQEKYNKHGIDKTPYVFVKADRGTYGMGIMTVHDANELLNINKKQRHSMSVIKDGIVNDEVLVQEGIPTIENMEGTTSEKMAYLVAGQVIGSVERFNSKKDIEDNLNSPGMDLRPASSLAVGYDLIARVAALATIFE